VLIRSDFNYDSEDELYDLSSDNCMVCNNSNNSHLLLICDYCNYNVCHTYCTNLDKIPDGEWHCRECIISNLKRSKTGSFINSLKINHILNDSDGESE